MKNHQFPYETFIQNSTLEYLKHNGWNKSPKVKELHEHGVDIRVQNNNFSRYWLIEVKLMTF